MVPLQNDRTATTLVMLSVNRWSPSEDMDLIASVNKLSPPLSVDRYLIENKGEYPYYRSCHYLAKSLQ